MIQGGKELEHWVSKRHFEAEQSKLIDWEGIKKAKNGLSISRQRWLAKEMFVNVNHLRNSVKK